MMGRCCRCTSGSCNDCKCRKQQRKCYSCQSKKCENQGEIHVEGDIDGQNQSARTPQDPEITSSNNPIKASMTEQTAHNFVLPFVSYAAERMCKEKVCDAMVQTESIAEQHRVVSPSEVARYRELGLGRGVNATDPEMWNNKSVYCVREIKDGAANIIGTEESCCKERYEKEVYTTSQNQLKLSMSLEDPYTSTKIGMDAHKSQSSSLMKRITGTRIKTRKIAFQVDLADLELTSSSAGNRHGREDNEFERNVCSWILERSSARRKTRGFKLDSSTNPSVKLVKHIENMKSKCVETPTQRRKSKRRKKRVRTSQKKGCVKLNTDTAREELNDIIFDFQLLIREFNTTHYVSAIKLGATKYSVYTSSTQQTTLGAGANFKAAEYAKGGMAAVKEAFSFLQSKEEQEIGNIYGEIRRGTTDEAVIGFEIKPIYTLLRAPLLQYAMRKAVKEYMAVKTSKSEGPFLISCKIGGKPVYWKVDEEKINRAESSRRSFSSSISSILSDSGLGSRSWTGDEHTTRNSSVSDSTAEEGVRDRSQLHGRLTIVGTDRVGEASLFYVIPAEDPSRPSDFFIAYWGKKRKDRKILTNITEPHACKRKTLPCLPHYLSVETDIFGQCDGPLELRSTVLIQQARFCLHSRLQHSFPLMCRSTPISLHSWFEGEEFYINCSQRSFKIDGYIGMQSDVQRVGVQYKTVSKPTIKDPTSWQAKGIGMLFRLHSFEYKRRNMDKGIEEPDGPCPQGTSTPVGSDIDSNDSVCSDFGWSDDD